MKSLQLIGVTSQLLFLCQTHAWGQGATESLLQRVIAQRVDREELLKLGQPAIAELTAGLKTVPSQDAGKVALALGRFGRQAKGAVSTLIELFPQEPQTEIAILISSMPTAQGAREKLFQELARKYGAGEVVAEATGTFQNNTIPNPKSLAYYYNTKVPAAAAALYMIVGEIPGVRQDEWRQWAAKIRK